MRLYKRSFGLRQIPNITVYITHSACTIHLLNLPDKNAKRDIVHGVKHLEEIAEGWLCARRTLGILSVLARKWRVELPEEASTVLARTDAKFGPYTGDVSSPPAVQRRGSQPAMNPSQFAQTAWQTPATAGPSAEYFNQAPVSYPSSGATATMSAPVRRYSQTHAPPPGDARGLQAQQYPSATATPQDQSHRMGRPSSAASPSDMFGGIEQLLRESNDWAYRDQAQWATGFDNWHSLDVDPSAHSWTGGAALGDGTNAALNSITGMDGMSGGAVGGAHATGVPMPDMTTSPTYAMNGASTSNGFAMNSWLNGSNPYNLASYNEEEWYQ